MVDKRIQTEVLLELMLSVGSESNEHLILKKSLSLYLRKLNCYSASVLKKSGKKVEEFFHIPIAAKNAVDWFDVKNYFMHVKPIVDKGYNEYGTKVGFYYGFKLSDYGYLLLGRKKSFDKSFLYDLNAVIGHLGKVLVRVHDIEQRLKTEQALRETEHRLQLSLEANKASVMEFNLKTGQIISTPDLFLHLGYSEDEIPKDFEAVSSFVFDEDVSVLHKAIDDHAKGITAEYYCEYRMYAKSGDLVWVDGQGKITARNENNEPVTLLGFSRDISKRKKAEEALILAKEKAEESDRLKSSFLANMSHEIRTPMNGILGFADLLKQPKVSGEDQQEYIRLIERSGIRLLNIINDLIDISKVESGQMKLFTQDTQINRQVKYIFDFFKPETEQKGLEFICKLPEPELEITINTDREKLYAVLTNLVKNAIKYTDEGSIEFGYYEDDADLVFYVKDSGVGISMSQQAAVFNRFIQADESNPRAYGGAGLGLSITKAYIEMMGGKIWLESEPDKGSTFYVSLPIIALVKK